MPIAVNQWHTEGHTAEGKFPISFCVVLRKKKLVPIQLGKGKGKEEWTPVMSICLKHIDSYVKQESKGYTYMCRILHTRM